MDPANAELLRYLEASEIAERHMPRVVSDAFCPSVVEVGGRKLRPVTLGAWLALEKVAHPLIKGGSIAIDEVLVGLYALSSDPRKVAGAISSDASRVMIATRLAGEVSAVELPEIRNTLAEHLSGAFATMVAMKAPGGVSGDSINPGFGWWLSILTNSVTRLGLSVDAALYDVPLTQLFAMNACRAWSDGLRPSGKTYLDDEIDRVLEDMRKH
jgi:hypothetical protein